jgi:general secretion pathway protein G
MQSGDTSAMTYLPMFRIKWFTTGFTLIELLVVMTVLAVLGSLVLPRYMDKVDTARETVLRQDLVGLRTAIDQFYRDQARYPDTLDELVSKRYIRTIPVDPITERADSWILVPPKEGAKAVFDVKSGANQRARDGSDYASW